MNPTSSLQATPKQQLSLFDSISIIVGIVIGVGIYETTPLIAQNTPGPSGFFAIWLIGGALSLIGALCYAELSTHYPYDGGDYVYLTRALGSKTGFLFVWTGFWVVRPANIAAVAFIFAHYAEKIYSIDKGSYGFISYAATIVIILTLINLFGVRSGKWTQNFLTIAKVLGLLTIFTVAMLYATPDPNIVSKPMQNTEFDFALAMILVLFTFGGWSNIAFVAAEVTSPRKNILRSLLISMGIITVIYLLVNFAFVYALGFHAVGQSQSIASDVVKNVFGEPGTVVISFLICVTCLGNINGMIFTEARIYYAMGREHTLYSWIGKWDRKMDTPVRALVIQALITILLITTIGINQDAFTRLVVFSAPVHWFFFFLVGVSLFILRHKDTVAKPAYRVPLYPLTPLIFCASTLLMLYASTSYAYNQKHPEIYVIVLIVLLGVLASLFNRDENQHHGQDKNSQEK